MTKVSQLLNTADQLRVISDSPQLDCEILLCHALQVDRAQLRTWPDATVEPEKLKRFEALLKARLQGTPIAYLIGSQGFWSLDLNVSPDTLIPRPETELIVEIALTLALPSRSGVLDLGTGTGAIALALASERQDWQLTAIDSQSGAVALAKQNCQRQGLDNVQIFQSDWFSEVTSDFDLIVSNPPYIEQDDPHLKQGDIRFEPSSALVSGSDGLDDLKKIINQSPDYLAVDGWLLVEHGCEQGNAVRNLFVGAGFSEVATRRDYNSLDRVTLGQWRR